MMVLRRLTGDKELWDSFVEYIDESIAKQHKALEQADNVILMHRSQGAIAALRKLKYLRDEINGITNS